MHEELKLTSPRAAALRILASRYGSTQPHAASHAYSLAEFQQEAVTRALAIMRQRNGVILADSVGLGKTFIAAAIIELALQANQSCVVIVPAAMCSMWTRELRPLTELHSEAMTIVSHGQLSRGCIPKSEGLVVVDEAHAFRSPHTRRYRALRRICVRSRVLLLTATPVNNSLSDLYFQLRLFAADNAFRDIGIGSLSALLNARETDTDALKRLRRAAIIRRTRSEVRSRFQDIALPSGQHLKFPGTVKLQTIDYEFSFSISDVGAMLTRIRFAAYCEEVAPILLRLSLLKRMQSGIHALATSLDRIISFYERYLSSLASGRLLRPRMLRDVAGEQLVFTELIANETPMRLNVDELHEAALSDLQMLASLRHLMTQSRDQKLDRLIALLHGRRNYKTVVFTEFVDTAQQLWRALQREFRVGLVTGTNAWLGRNAASRLDVIRRFAPRNNGAPEPPAHEAVDVLIATDVLAEGLNLQDADAVVSYDLPWNPVRLIQRAGRVDRIGSLHDVVQVYNFLPDRQFDQLLGLIRTLRTKLLQVRQAVGQENVVLEPDELDVDFLEALRAGWPELLEEEPADQRFHTEHLDLSDAAAIGSVASSPNGGRRVLVCLQRSAQLFEVIVCDGDIGIDSKAADEILGVALQHDAVSDFSAEGSIERAVDYLQRELACPRREGNETQSIAREIKTAVQRLGVFISERTLAEAERTLQMLPAFLGNRRSTHVLIREARNESQLVAALRAIQQLCTPMSAHEDAEIRLVAAIAAD